jgi:OmpA-OmpF porin, OOP family
LLLLVGGMTTAFMKRVGLIFIGITIAALSATAHANVEIGGTLGAHIFSETNGLGVPDKSPDSFKNSAMFGVRLTVFFNKMLGVEGEVGMIPGEPRGVLVDAETLTYRAHVIAQFLSDDEKTLQPFALAGAGAHQVVYTSDATLISKETNIVPEIGLGVKYRTGTGMVIRFDARALFPPSSSGGMTVDYEGLLGVAYEIGAKKKKKVEPPPPPKDDDPDHDGIKGAADKCPSEPEDKDGFQDEDGCPDPDNDGDGILDKDDKCPNEAEDKDGFQDEDGCPDPDNDNDGIPDKDDKCPGEPETKNGYQDEDGCPDEVPEKLKAFTGVIQGITFQTNSTAFAGTTTKTLDGAAAVLTEFKDIHLEIQGHSDDEAIRPGGKFPDNMSLSQARADAVKEYLTKKGIDASRLTAKGYGDTVPVVDPKGLTGPALNAARGKNRRVEFKLLGAGGAPTP